MPARVTLQQIADRLGLSVSTVSRVLNNSILISEERAASILEAAHQLGYVKRQIRRHSHRSILNLFLVLPSREETDLNIFYALSQLIEGIRAGLADVRVNVIVKLNRRPVDFYGIKKLGDMDGCIFAFTQPDRALFDALDARGIPVILINRRIARRNYVVADDAAGMRRLVKEVVDRRGRHRPAFLGFRQVLKVSRSRFQGVESACRELGIAFTRTDAYEVKSLRDIDARFVERIARTGHDALLCFNDTTAIFAFQAAGRAGIRIPEDLSLTGFDNSPLRDVFFTRIDTIELSSYAFGRDAGVWLRKAIIERQPEGIQKLIEGTYVPGETI